MKPLYSAVLDGINKIKIFNVSSGISSCTVNLGDVVVVNGPVLTQDKMTLVVKDRSGNMSGKVYTLPRGVLSYSFQIK